METIKDFFKSIFDNSVERMQNPFIGSVFISYLIFNWEMFAILIFEDWSIHCKIEWIQERYYNYYNFVVPVIVSLFYILILPYLNIFFDLILSTSTRISERKKNLLNTNKLLTEERNAHQRRKIADAEAGTSATKDLNDRITNLTEELNALNERNKLDSERHREIEKRSTEIENDLKNKLKLYQLEREELESEFKKDKQRLKSKLIPSNYSEIIQLMTEQERHNFLVFAERFKSKDLKAVESIRGNVDKLLAFNLIKADGEGNVHLTDKGNQLYYFITI